MPKMKSAHFVLLLAVLLFAAAAPAQDWKGRGRLQGEVINPDKEPIVGARITLLLNGEAGRGPESFVTNNKGRWSFTGLAGGDWTVRIEAPGYRISEGTLPVIEYGGGPGKPVVTTLNPDVDAARKAQADRLMSKIEEGNQLLMSGKFAEARAAYQHVLAELDPKEQLPLLQGVADTYLNEGNFAEARSRFEALLPQLEPAQQPGVWRKIARTHFGEKQIDLAIADLEKALALVPDDLETLRLIIDVFVSQGREKAAEPYMARLPQGTKIDPNTLLNLGITEYNNNNMDAALTHFQKVVQEYPDNPDGYYYRGRVYLSKGDNPAAIADLEKMLQLAPQHANAADAKQFLEYLRGQ